MNTILAAITISAMALCGPNKNIIKEDLIVKKPPEASTSKPFVYRKVPTNWVKMPKKSN
jgi:hypothetical protein